MKTITEFSGFTLKDAMSKKAALLTEGKTEEEAQASINELLKLDESKSTFYKNVVDMTSSRVDRVKRVVVATKANETEKVPENYFEREGHFYLVEFFPDPNARHAPAYGNDRDDRGGRGGQGRGGRGGNDRNGRGGGGGRPGSNDRGNSFGGNNNDRGGFGGGERRPRDEMSSSPRPTMPRPEGSFMPRIEGAPPPVFPKKDRAPRPPRADKGAREPRAPRPPRAEGAARPERGARGPKGAGELRLVLKGQTTTLQGSGVNEPTAAAPVAPTSET